MPLWVNFGGPVCLSKHCLSSIEYSFNPLCFNPFPPEADVYTVSLIWEPLGNKASIKEMHDWNLILLAVQWPLSFLNLMGSVNKIQYNTIAIIEPQSLNIDVLQPPGLIDCAPGLKDLDTHGRQCKQFLTTRWTSRLSRHKHTFLVS